VLDPQQTQTCCGVCPRESRDLRWLWLVGISLTTRELELRGGFARVIVPLDDFATLASIRFGANTSNQRSVPELREEPRWQQLTFLAGAVTCSLTGQDATKAFTTTGRE
jgi:hypothetical protein